MSQQHGIRRLGRHGAIRLDVPRDVMYWAGLWGLSDLELREAIEAAGPEPADVAAWLGQPIGGENLNRGILRAG